MQLQKPNNHSWLSKNWIFWLILSYVIIDRVFTLVHFGFIFTDIDQVILWDAANDYSQGYFNEPFFYGQDYNFMLEAFLAAPLLWLDVPVNYALPIITTILAILPFVCASFFFKRLGKPFWSYSILLFLLLLPIEFNCLTTISRGFVQAGLFLPFLIYGFIYPQKEKYHIVLYISAAFCFILNSSSILIIVPVLIYVLSFNYKRLRFYLKAIAVVPVYLLSYWAKQFYVLNPERRVHYITGLEIDSETFVNSITSTDHFNYLFPIDSTWGYTYLLLILVFIVFACIRKKYKALLFLSALLALILLTFSIPKVQILYENAGVMFTRSRLYTVLPISFFLGIYLLLKDCYLQGKYLVLVPIFGLIALVCKNWTAESSYMQVANDSRFPMESSSNLMDRVKALNAPAQKYKVDLVLHENKIGWLRIFENYAFKSVNRIKNNEPESSSLEEDRRMWIPIENKVYKTILLNDVVIPPNSPLFDNVQYTKEGYVLLVNNTLPLLDFFKEIRRDEN